MVFSMISGLKWKGAATATASERSPLLLPPCDLNCSTKASTMGIRISGILRDLKPDWGNLPRELLGEIGKRMVSGLEIVCFRSVCKKWRSSLPSPTGRFQLLLPPPPSCDPEFRHMPYAISELTLYHHEVGGWPATQVDEGSIFTLSRTLSFGGDKAEFDRQAKVSRRFPPLDRLSLFAKAYYPYKALYSREMRLERECNKFPKKLVLISSPNAYGVDPNYARMCDLIAVAHLDGEMKGRLALLRLGGSPQNWVWDTDFCTQVFVNIATYKGQLCTLDECGRVFLMDYNSLKLTLLCAPPSNPFELEQKSLFESCGDLYLVDFKRRSLDDAEAYRLSLSSQMWLRVEGDMCMTMRDLSHVSPFLL